MPDIREVRVTLTTQDDGTVEARSKEVPGLLLDAEDVQELIPNIPLAIQTTFQWRGFPHVVVTLVDTKRSDPTTEVQLYEVNLGDQP